MIITSISLLTLTLSSWLVDSPDCLLHCNLPPHPHHPHHPLRHLLQTETEEEIQLWSEEIQKHGKYCIGGITMVAHQTIYTRRSCFKIKSQSCGRTAATTSNFNNSHEMTQKISLTWSYLRSTTPTSKILLFIRKFHFPPISDPQNLKNFTGTFH